MMMSHWNVGLPDYIRFPDTSGIFLTALRSRTSSENELPPDPERFNIYDGPQWLSQIEMWHDYLPSWGNCCLFQKTQSCSHSKVRSHSPSQVLSRIRIKPPTVLQTKTCHHTLGATQLGSHTRLGRRPFGRATNGFTHSGRLEALTHVLHGRGL